MKEEIDMKCKNMRSKLVEYYENTLSPEERKLIQDHLESCSNCQKELQKIGSTFEILRKESTFEPEELYWTNFVPGVRSRIDKGKEISVEIFPKRKIAGAFITFLFVIILGIFLFRIDQKVIFEAGEEAYTYLIPTEDENIEKFIYTEGYDGSYAFLFTDTEKKKLTVLEEELEEDYWERAGREEAFRELDLEELKNLKNNLEKIEFRKEIL